jgi:plasmid stabilization system protein ParE
MYRLSYTPATNYDISDITEYLSKFYPSTSYNFFTKLERSVSVLKRQPYLYAKFIYNPQFRHMIVNDYIVLYKVFENPNRVEIHRILHGSRNIENIKLQN